MYKPDNLFTINIFKDKEPWESLSKYNDEVISACNKAKYSSDNSFDTSKGGASNWFNAEELKRSPIYPENPYYPSPHPVQLEPKFNLVMHSANYVTLFLVNALYGDTGNPFVTIEDICCGMSQLTFYLSKLKDEAGERKFECFSLIDNFSHMPQHLLENFMKSGDIGYTLNRLDAPAVVSNIVAYPVYVKRITKEGRIYSFDKLEPPPDDMYISPTVELFCSYYPITEVRGLSGLDNKKFFHEERFVPLCEDSDHMLFAYVRSENYDYFREKLKDWALPNWGHRDLDKKIGA